MRFKELFEDNHQTAIAPYNFSTIETGDVVNIKWRFDKEGYILSVWKNGKFVANLPFDNEKEARDEGWDI